MTSVRLLASSSSIHKPVNVLPASAGHQQLASVGIVHSVDDIFDCLKLMIARLKTTRLRSLENVEGGGPLYVRMPQLGEQL